MVLDLKYVSDSCWVEVCKKVKNASVFVDDRAAECLHWHGGLIRLLEAGASEVKQFSSFEDGDISTKGVFLVGSPLIGPTRMVLRDIISNSSFQHCILIMSFSPIVLSIGSTSLKASNDFTALHELELDMLCWMKNKTYTAEIFHFPFGLVPITNYFFCIPTLQNVIPWIRSSDMIQQCLRMREWDIEQFPHELQVSVISVMTSLNSLLSQINVQEDIYCFGPFSSFVGCHLQKHSTSILRAKTATSKMGLLIIDRTFDVCSVMYYGKKVFLDLMKSVLPPFPGHNVDVAINMSSLCAVTVDNGYELAAPGCLHEPQILDVFEYLFCKNTQEIVQKLCHVINELCSDGTNKKCSTLSELEEVTKEYFKEQGQKIKEHVGILQIVVGVIETLKSESLLTQQRTESFQKLLLQLLAPDSGIDETVEQLLNIINSRCSEGLTLENIFAILVFFYNVIGEDFCLGEDEEELLKHALIQTINEEQKLEVSTGFLDISNIADVKEYCQEIFRKLNHIKTSRSHLIKYKSLTSTEGPMMPLHYSNLIHTLICDIVDVLRPDIPDLLHKPNLAVRENFTSRFSMMLNSSRPHLMDHQDIMIFVIGGITSEEVKFVKDCFKAFKKNIIIGSTAFVSPALFLENLFVNDPSNPFLF